MNDEMNPYEAESTVTDVENVGSVEPEATVTDESQEPEEKETVTAEGETDELGDRIELLRQRQSVDSEYLEFARLFPGVEIANLPDSVCESVRRGVPLAAAYALYEKKNALSAYDAAATNEKNASLSFQLKENGGEKYFSPDEVKAMSREDVRENYSRIIESMRHWR